MMKKNTDEALRCSFCDASQNEVKKLIAGKSVFICDKCVGVCQEIIDEDQNYDVSPRSVHLPKPLEIKSFLISMSSDRNVPRRNWPSRFTTITSESRCPGRN